MTDVQKEEQKRPGQTFVGTVISDKMDKTIIVKVDRKVKHELYGKYLQRSSKMCAHDEKNTCKVGDLVKISSSRPLSKTKSFVLVEVLEQAENDITQ
jgi:small subunit ribosomal protein S17